MIFKFPQKKIVLDCFTSEVYAIEYAPITSAIKHMPEWWRNLPPTYSAVTETNMRHCPGMVDYYKRSVTIPLWTDLSITVNSDKNINWLFSDSLTGAVHHPRSQYSGFLENFTHMKIDSPWFFRSEKKVDWLWSHPTYNYQYSDDAVSVPGVINFYYQHAVQINMFIKADKEKQILIPQGQPMAVLTPLSDRKVEVIRHLVSKSEIENMRKKMNCITFKSKYKKIINRVDKFADCPYHNKSN